MPPQPRANMVYQNVDGIMLAVHTAAAPSDEEWSGWMRLIQQVPIEALRIFVFTDGGAPTTPQRGQFTDYLASRPVPAAILSTSMVVRGVVTAISWFDPAIKAFRPDDLKGALTHVGCNPADAAKVLAAARRLAGSLSAPVRVLG